jgi:hypothetical protein
MPTATALRCFIAVLEEQSEGGKPVGGADTGQRIMARPNRVLSVSLFHLLTCPCSPLILLPESQDDRCHTRRRGWTDGRDVFL